MQKSMEVQEFIDTHVPGHLLTRFKEEMSKWDSGYSCQSFYRVRLMFGLLAHAKLRWEWEV